MKSSSNADLISEVGYQLLKMRLLPLADVVTPNLLEAEKLAEQEITNVQETKEAASHIQMLGPKSVLITGCCFKDEDTVSDMLDKGDRYIKFSSEKLDKEEMRGTGCLLSTSIAANLALDRSLMEAITEAEKYCRQKILASKNIGSGEVYQSDLSQFEVGTE